MRARRRALGANALVALALTVGPGRAEARDGWFGVDKVKHFLVSAFIQSVTYSTLQAAGAERRAALAGATGVTLGVGLAREWHDRRQGRPFSVRDLAWDGAGTGAASLLLLRTER